MKNKRGQSMFELLVAVFVVAITLVAILGLVTGSIGSTNFSKERTQASKFSQEAVEWLRGQRDANWVTFKAKGVASPGQKYCLSSLSWSSVGGCSSTQFITNSIFRREVTMIYNSAVSEVVEARVATIWNDSTGVHESTVVTYFTNWRTR